MSQQPREFWVTAVDKNGKSIRGIRIVEYEALISANVKIAELELKLEKAKEALKFYGDGNNFVNGVIVSSDIEPAVKITGQVVYHYSDPPIKTDAWIGGKLARQTLAKIKDNK